MPTAEPHQNFVLRPLGADADLDDTFACHWADGGDELFAQAVVAADESFVALGADAGFVDNHRRVALIAFEFPIAVWIGTGDERRVAAAVEQEDRLLAAIKCFVDAAFECGSDDREREGFA